MAEKYKVIKSGDVVKPKRKSPAQLILDDLGDEYKTVDQLAERYGVHKETIRRIMRAQKDGEPLVNAPSEAVQQGGFIMYLFTDDDVAEMDEFMSKKGYEIKKVKK